MSYLKDKTIIDFLVEVENLLKGEASKLNQLDYFVVGHTTHAFFERPNRLASILGVFSLIHQYEECQALSEPQKKRLFISVLSDPETNIEEKIERVVSEDIEENKQSDPPSVKKAVQIYDQLEPLLFEHIALTEEHERLEPIDMIMWGFFCRRLSETSTLQQIFEKLLTIRQSEVSGLLNHNQKMRIFIKLYNDWELDLNTSIAKLIENPALGSKSLASLVISEDKLNEILAEQMTLEEKIGQDKARIEKEKQDKEGILCNICWDGLYEREEDVFVMGNCEHCFHESCLNLYLIERMKTKKLPITCPQMYCPQELSHADLKELMSEENVEKFFDLALQSFLMRNSRTIAYCPTADCPFVFFLNPDLVQFDCPQCKISYCLRCRDFAHKDKCKTQVEQFIRYAESFNLKSCPNCKVWVEKVDGCNHMTCICGLNFCYYCGKMWNHLHYCESDRKYYRQALLELAKMEEQKASEPKKIANANPYPKIKKQKLFKKLLKEDKGTTSAPTKK